MNGARSAVKGLELGGVPRVHLMPPEFEERRKAEVLIRRLLAAGAAVLVVILLSVGAASLQLAVTNSALASEQARTATLATEQAKYAVVTTINSQTSQIESMQPQAATGEIMWEPYLALVGATLPADTTISAFVAELSSSSTPTTTAAVLQAPHVATLKLTADSPQASVSDWLDNMSKLKGFVDATPQSVTLVKETGRYTVQVDLFINEDALANQFDLKKRKK